MPSHADEADHLYLTYVPLDRQGYTRRGKYFGTGAKLYEYDGVVGGHSVYGALRAHDRAAAKAQLRSKYPRAKIGR